MSTANCGLLCVVGVWGFSVDRCDEFARDGRCADLADASTIVDLHSVSMVIYLELQLVALVTSDKRSKPDLFITTTLLSRLITGCARRSCLRRYVPFMSRGLLCKLTVDRWYEYKYFAASSKHFTMTTIICCFFGTWTPLPNS